MISKLTQSILMLTAHLSSNETGTNPLTIKEWGKLADFLKENKLSPEQLVNDDIESLLAGFSDAKITIARLKKLLQRGTLLALTSEKWLRSGLWILNRSEKEYPRKLKKRLGNNAPPIIFGFGNKNLLNQDKVLGCVGSRKVQNNHLMFSNDLGKLAADSGYSVISGAAKGVDESFMMGALKSEGTAIGVVSDSLLQKGLSKLYRQYIERNDLVLISTFYPEAGFNVGNAMQRNKYVYCISEAVIIPYSGNTGGTIAGALENLKKQWVPTWVVKDNDKKSGNQEIVNAGADWISQDISQISFKKIFSSATRQGNFDF